MPPATVAPISTGGERNRGALTRSVDESDPAAVPAAPTAAVPARPRPAPTPVDKLMVATLSPTVGGGGVVGEAGVVGSSFVAETITARLRTTRRPLTGPLLPLSREIGARGAPA